MQKILKVLLPVALIAIWSAPASAAAKGPIKSLKRTNTQINKLLKVKTVKGSAKEKRIKGELTTAVNRFLDFRELARRSLAKHWKARTEAERTEFVDVLRQLIEHNYLSQMRSNLDYNVEYRSEKVKGDKARVTTVIKVVKNKRPEEVIVKYKMRRKNEAWVVYDVITDDVSIVRNYRRTFNRIIKKKSYQALVKKMRKKLAKLQKKG
jgi:phospholipid transport system substrate-binding protein